MSSLRRVGVVLDRAAPWIAIACIVAAGIVLHNQAKTIRRQGRQLAALVHTESVQRVHTIGERCEATHHQAMVLHNNLPASHQGEAAWFNASYERCLVSLAKVEARAGVTYKP